MNGHYRNCGKVTVMKAIRIFIYKEAHVCDASSILKKPLYTSL